MPTDKPIPRIYMDETSEQKVTRPSHGLSRLRYVGYIGNICHQVAPAAHVHGGNQDHNNGDEKHHQPLNGISPENTVHAAPDGVCAGYENDEKCSPRVGKNLKDRIQEVSTSLSSKIIFYSSSSTRKSRKFRASSRPPRYASRKADSSVVHERNNGVKYIALKSSI